MVDQFSPPADLVVFYALVISTVTDLTPRDIAGLGAQFRQKWWKTYRRRRTSNALRPRTEMIAWVVTRVEKGAS